MGYNVTASVAPTPAYARCAIPSHGDVMTNELLCENCNKNPATRIVEDHSGKVMHGTAKLCAKCAVRAAETIQRDGGIPAIGNL